MRKLKKIAYLTLWMLLVSGLMILLGFSYTEQHYRYCGKTYISIDYGQSDHLVNNRDIDSLIIKVSGKTGGKSLGWVNVQRIEHAVNAHEYIEKAHVYSSLDGNLFVEVRQREPILRVINISNKSFYLDASGYVLPCNADYPARVPVANGNIHFNPGENQDFFLGSSVPCSRFVGDTLLQELYRLATYIHNDRFLQAETDQIFVTPEKEFELVPKAGNHIILLGNTENLDEKLGKLHVFYEKGLNQIGWNKYNYINIKYKNQVICSKL